jgi:enterochelin esterase-like enzyme
LRPPMERSPRALHITARSNREYLFFSPRASSAGRPFFYWGLGPGLGRATSASDFAPDTSARARAQRPRTLADLAAARFRRYLKRPTIEARAQLALATSRTAFRADGVLPQESVISRRQLLAAVPACLLPTLADAQVDPAWRPQGLDLREIRVEGGQSRRFVLGVPTHLAAGERAPLLVLLHGLGETGDERAGAWAWFERYGLGTSYDRLRARGAMRGLVFACPYMPNLPIGDPRAFDSYARWLVEAVAGRARLEAPVLDGSSSTYLCGCSLGGHFSLEVMLRRADAFGAWGGVQTAVSEQAGARYARRLVDAIGQSGPRALLVETSTADPFRAGSVGLSTALARAGIANTFIELPGAHDQRWLRASGTERMLAWFDGLPRP